MILLYVFSGILGLVVGSFLNVVILRYGTGLSISKGRSACFSCNTKLSMIELIPLLSYLIQKGRCRTCGSAISAQYPMVELLTSLSAVALVHLFLIQTIDAYQLAILFGIFCVLIAIAVYDIRHKIIPDGMVATFIFLTILFALLHFINTPYYPIVGRYVNLFAGVILFVPFWSLWYFSGGRWIGLGDGKLAIGIGTLLGLPSGLSAIAVAFWVGAFAALSMLVVEKYRVLPYLYKRVPHLTMKSEIPFAPFLIIATILSVFFPLDLFSLHYFGF